MDIGIERLQHDDGVTLAVRGRLDAECADELRHAAEEELRHGFHAITLDLDGVTFLSSAGIRVLFEAQRAVKAAGGSCFIGTASEPVRKVLDLTRLTPILMASAQAAQAGPHTATAPPRPADIRVGDVLLVGLEPCGSAALPGTLLGSAAAVDGDVPPAVARPLPRHVFAIGLGALAGGGPLADQAGELLAAGGAVFHRPPQPFAAVDYLLGSGDLVPEVQFASGLLWHGLPAGRAGFEPATEDAAVRLDDLAGALLDRGRCDTIAFVVVAEVHGLVGAELIRALAAATPADRPRAATREVAARWLEFSREPVHARHTAIVVGVATRGPATGALSGFVRPLGRGGVLGHAHAAVFPHRSLKRGAIDLAATLADVTAAEPLAVMHLLGDPQPVLGSGQSEFVRGACWFGPLTIAEHRA
ncbi:MAG: anti-sigma factor antagonist [Planctomycetota bacterium]|jgi:anti-sigma B factor antagonist|nr:MAG: anti-sigma factor antagonist [Planctomycetota bacterium]